MPDRDPAQLAARTAKARKLVANDGSRKLLQSTYPLTFDWRDRGVVPPPRNQGGCGSCWAFAAVGAMEIKAGIDGVSLRPDTSEQQLVDCVGAGVGANGYGSYGCNGGWSGKRKGSASMHPTSGRAVQTADCIHRLSLHQRSTPQLLTHPAASPPADEAFSYAANFFVTSEANYPYTGTTGTCRQAAMPVTGSMTVASPGYRGLYPSAQEIMRAVSSNGPTVMYFNVVDNFYGYSGGVYQASQCNANTYNHAM